MHHQICRFLFELDQYPSFQRETHVSRVHPRIIPGLTMIDVIRRVDRHSLELILLQITNQRHYHMAWAVAKHHSAWVDECRGLWAGIYGLGNKQVLRQ